MKKAILWTIAFVLVMAATLLNGWVAAYGALAWAMMGLALVCTLLQWIAYFKSRK